MQLGSSQDLEALESRLRMILPETYQDCYEDVQPISMGSAGLKYDSEGKVAWDDIWGSFCDLAMAGGPPHKGILLEPGSSQEIQDQPDHYQAVVDEICRGIFLVTDIKAQASQISGWIEVGCESRGMAGWLTRAIVMENISALNKDSTLFLPAGPGFRIEKEIKNVITSIAKTCHYWQDHMWSAQHRDISLLFAQMEEEAPLLQPAFSGHGWRTEQEQLIRQKIGEVIQERTTLQCSTRSYKGWIGIECPDVQAAIWMMRAIVVSNSLARREETTLFLPVNLEIDPDGERLIRVFQEVYSLALFKNVI